MNFKQRKIYNQGLIGFVVCHFSFENFLAVHSNISLSKFHQNLSKMSYKIEIELLMPDREACEDLLKHLREVKRRDSNGESDEVKCVLEELSTLTPISNPYGVVTSYSVKLIPDEEDEDERQHYDVRTTIELSIPSIEEMRKENIKIQEALDKFGKYESADDETCPYEFSASSEVVFPCEAADNVNKFMNEVKKREKKLCICPECHKSKTNEEVQCNVS